MGTPNAYNDSGNITDTSKKDHDVDISTSNNKAPVASSRQVIDNYLRY